jgi:predicted transcriptional regulator
MKVTDKRIIQALRASGVCKTHAAKMLGISLQSLNYHLKTKPKLQEVFEEVREETTDLAESSLIALLREHNVVATIFYLKTLAKQRGYKENVDDIGNLDDINESLKSIGEKLPG